MRVLVVGTEDWAVEQAVEQLEASGCEALTCHPPGERAFPCNVFVDGATCPLTVGFEIAVTIRTRPLDEPALGEFGALCALRIGTPLISAGMAGRNPFARWSQRVVGGLDNLAGVVAEVAASAREPLVASP
jgi:hypothetical protein